MRNLSPRLYQIHTKSQKNLNISYDLFVQAVYRDSSSQVHTLRRIVREKDEAIQKQSTLEKKLHELERRGSLQIQVRGEGDGEGDVSPLPSPPQPMPLSPCPDSLAGACAGAAYSSGSSSQTGTLRQMATPPPPPPPPPPMTMSSSE